MAAFTVVGLVSFAPKSDLSVTSPDFKNDGMVPAKYSCEGTGVSPALQISKAPAGTKILQDPDAPMPGGFTHWVMWNIPTDGKIAEDYKGAEQGLNGIKKNGYKGMCPPTGTHHYHFMVYAVDTKLTIDKNTDKAGLEKAMEGHILATGDLVGLYKKEK